MPRASSSAFNKRGLSRVRHSGGKSSERCPPRDLVPAGRHQPDLFAPDTNRRQKLSPLVDRINDRIGRCAIGFGLFPPDVRAFKGHAAFHRVPESWEF